MIRSRTAGPREDENDVTTLYVSHPAALEHEVPSGHPERPDRMRAVERANDPKLAQRLLEVIEQMHQDADALRSIDDEIASGVIRCQ